MSLLRAFIAVELPTELRQRIGETTAGLQREIGPLVRWVPVQNMHLTLKFLGDVAPSHVEMLSQMVSAEAQDLLALVEAGIDFVEEDISRDLVPFRA